TNEKDGESVTVTFENGMVVMADSSARRLEDRLGNVLVKQGRITRERLDEALAVQRQTLQRLGHILASGSAITTKDLRDALQVQISQIVFRVFRWRDGRYQFAPADAVDYDRENFVPMSTDFILMEGIRMVDEWPIIEKKVPSFDIVFRPVVDPSLIDVGAGAGPEASGAERRVATGTTGRIRLAPEEERVFRKVDGVRTVQAIIDATGAGEFDVCRTLFDFLNRNLIAPAGRGTAPSLEESEVRSAASSMPGYVVAGLVVALALAGLVLGRRSPFGVTGLPSLLAPLHAEVHDYATWWRLERLEGAIEAWRATRGAAPPALEDLVAAGVVDPSHLVDGWARPFHYERSLHGYVLSAVDETGASRADATLDRRGGR
ncbi:MAG TPA: DUF4388 domain-containing protein, partial [Vicinamibacteria bacterium]|nr:DUF4388 domain-containing protein [Vicinamibacteria bacterium]